MERQSEKIKLRIGLAIITIMLTAVWLIGDFVFYYLKHKLL